ncbi:hypothetical protein HMF8227_00303 [Saliniradius amylolyticus]|uniref:Uncharacterized protein n=1 Tax=Saliniradius amylolyticus TaxID=2183582 RepID=A0A2S2DZJ3_9ALTE|nr:hypothetical protein [Saliniradius amylolyticus]AWL10811.1 hypothetical protein HMF8227_00303 [Saliniradius amylolyticus]
MSQLNVSVIQFGYHQTQKTLQQRIQELQPLLTQYEQLMKDEPEFRYQYELERDSLTHQIREIQWQLENLSLAASQVA